jgi:hypothetical protein
MSNHHSRNIRLHKARVRQVLPEHYQSNYPKLIELLDLYYEFLSTHPEHNFDDIISEIILAHDLDLAGEKNTEYLSRDLTVGEDYSSAMTDFKTKGPLFVDWYRSKGSLYSIERFFRWMFNESVEVEYGKNSVFMLNEDSSKIGTTSQKYIKNDKLYQVFALLIKVGIPGIQWRDLYKRLCHPAGFYFQSYVILESIGNYYIRDMIGVVPPQADPLESSADVHIQSISGVFSYYPSEPSGADVRVGQLSISAISELEVSDVIHRTDSIAEFVGPNSPTFDSVDDAVAEEWSPKMSDDRFETMDEERHDKY